MLRCACAPRVAPLRAAPPNPKARRHAALFACRALRSALAGLCRCPARRSRLLVVLTRLHPFPPLRRQDFLKQLFRWAVQDCENGGVEVYATPMQVEVIDISEVLSIGFAITLMDIDAAGNEVPGLRLECLMDELEVAGYDRVGMGDDGFPVLETLDGQAKVVKGKCFIVRRDATKEVPAALQAPAKMLINNLMEATKRYYSFGSCFSEEF